MSQAESSAILAINHYALTLNQRMTAGDIDKALEAIAELRLATTELKRILTHG